MARPRHTQHVEDQHAVVGDDGATAGEQSKADKRGAVQDVLGAAIRRNAHDAAASAERRGDVKIRLAVKGHALRAAQSAVEDVNFASLRNAIDAIVAGSRRSGNVQVATGVKHQMISGDGRFQGGKNENLALRADFENGAAAIANK